MAITPANREPQKITAGDTISFLKSLGDYLATAGWSLVYELSGPNGSYEFTSAAAGASHQVTIAAAASALYVPGDYELVGFAVNADSGERVQFYQAPCPVAPNVAAGDAIAPTHAQKMITLLEAVMLGKAGHDILESDIEGTRVKRLSPQDLRGEYNYWKAVRAEEIAAERAALGLPSKRKIVPRFQITRYQVPVGIDQSVFPR